MRPHSANAITTKDTKYHEGLWFLIFLRVPSCPLWLMLFHSRAPPVVAQLWYKLETGG